MGWEGWGYRPHVRAVHGIVKSMVACTLKHAVQADESDTDNCHLQCQ